MSFEDVNYFIDMPPVWILNPETGLLCESAIATFCGFCCLKGFADKFWICLREMREQGVTEGRLKLLQDVTGAFRPGVLTALMGFSGAGKTTLLDVLAGRRTGGYIEGNIRSSGFPKKQETFARISGYCEQNGIHSPQVTVWESLLYSAFLRLLEDVDKETRIVSLQLSFFLVYLAIVLSLTWYQIVMLLTCKTF